MKISKTHRLILYSLGQFYRQLNQPLQQKPIELETSKIAFITFLLHSGIVTKQSRALYKNLEILEEKKLIAYNHRMIHFTDKGLQILIKIDAEVEMFLSIQKFFVKKVVKPRKKLQTKIRT
jgi:hypothetical protein